MYGNYMSVILSAEILRQDFFVKVRNYFWKKKVFFLFSPYYK